VNRLGGEVIASFNYRARFLPKWQDLCERTLGRQLETTPELERLHTLRDSVLGLSRRAGTPGPSLPGPATGGPGRVRAQDGEVGRGDTTRRVIDEFQETAGGDLAARL
jgi:hypothetical protein